MRFFLFCALLVLVLVAAVNVVFLVLMKDYISPVFAASSLSFIGIVLRYTAWSSKAYIESDNYLVSPLRLLEY